MVVSLQSAKKSTDDSIRSCKTFLKSKKKSRSRGVTWKVRAKDKGGQTTILANNEDVERVETSKILALLDQERTLDRM